ncbi:MAG: molecular chaperone DnaK [Candidatus Thermoplasmatota archaeon]|nr:molecular chaperone DnaK [Candidatus Thermoplasmatota archaeon]
MSKIIGIDLGTSNSAAAVVVNGNVKIIPSAEGLALHGKMFPSVITFLEEGKVIVGKDAKKLMAPGRTITNIKRKMGTDYKIKIGKKWYIPQELSALILKKIKKDAELYLNESIKKAVITCPAYFNDNQRTATRDAGVIAGLDVVRIINEPTAAALAYGLDKTKRKLNIAVLDLGGGTFDVTILEMCNSVFRVIATSGDTQLGGIDMDNKILDYLVDKLRGEALDLKAENLMQVLRNEAEKAKINLSSKLSTTINSPFTNVNINLTRTKLEELIEDVISRMDKPLEQALADSNLAPKDIDKIILVGGPTKMPVVRKKVKEFFGRVPERGIDPMHCVAAGAAIQGSVLSGELGNIALLDVTPLSLGIETSGTVFTRLIHRNTTIPVEESRIFTTAQDFQSVVPIHVLQGERALAHDNITLGVFNLTGIKPAPRHEPMIEVTFSIDGNGILHVSAEDLETGKKQAIEITESTRLPKEEISRMINEAAVFAELDKRKENEIKLRTRAEALIYELGQVIKKEKLPIDEKRNITTLVKELKHALRVNNNEQVKSATEELNKLVDRIALRNRAASQANALIQSAKKMITEIKIPKAEKAEVEERIEKLKEALKNDNTKEIEKQIGELTEELTILEVDYK